MGELAIAPEFFEQFQRAATAEAKQLRAHIKELRGQARHTERYAEVLEGHVSRETRRAAWKSASMSRAALAGKEENDGGSRAGPRNQEDPEA